MFGFSDGSHASITAPAPSSIMWRQERIWSEVIIAIEASARPAFVSASSTKFAQKTEHDIVRSARYCAPRAALCSSATPKASAKVVAWTAQWAIGVPSLARPSR